MDFTKTSDTSLASAAPSCTKTRTTKKEIQTNPPTFRTGFVAHVITLENKLDSYITINPLYSDEHIVHIDLHTC